MPPTRWPLRSRRPLLHRLLLAVLIGLFVRLGSLEAQTSRRRWERQCEIRREKFDRILPEAMRENGVDMWITMMKENNWDPLYDDLGRGYAGSIGYYVFTDRGGARIERAALGIEGHMLEGCRVYDIVTPDLDLKAFVAARNPKRIGINVSDEIGMADGLTHTNYELLRKTLGEPWVSRLTSAEKVVSDFRSRHTAAGIVAFGEAGEMSRQIAEEVFSNRVITPGVTTLEDAAWWMWDQLLSRGLGSSFDMPSVYVTGADGVVATSSDRIVQRGDLLMVDWGVGHLGYWTDMKRIAYVLREGETAAPKGIQNAFDQALKVREIIRGMIKPGVTAQQMLDRLNAGIAAAGFPIMKEFNKPSSDPRTEVIIGCHSVGDRGHGSGPSIAFFNPKRLTFTIRPTNMFSIELFAWTPAPEWGGKKVRIPLEDDAIVTDRGVEWVYPVNERILLIK